MTSAAFSKDVLGALENARPTPDAIGMILIRALELAGQDRLPAAVISDLETSVYRLAGLPIPGSTPLVTALARWEQDKWGRVLAAVAGG